ncbi:hypothetical protein TL18_04430 [Methanobrevibacter sp. YE315]|nr:hypothetical protein TL18_04430 [Methanobrevibacter sp. YE315]
MDKLQVSNDDEILAANVDFTGSTLNDLQEFLNSGQVQAGDTLYLGNKSITTNNWEPWNYRININIPNIVISGGTSSNPDSFSSIIAPGNIFILEASGITIKNIKFTNTFDSQEANCKAVDIRNSNCNIEDCTFENFMGPYGGAISVNSAATNTNIDGCNFTNNRGIWNPYGGAIYIDASDVKVNDCNFEGNSAQYGDAIYSNNANSQISDCTFKDKNGFTVTEGVLSLKLTIKSDYSNVIGGNAQTSNLKFWDGSSYRNKDDIPTWPIVQGSNQNVSVQISDSSGVIYEVSGVTDENGVFICNYGHLPEGSYTYRATYSNNGTSTVIDGSFEITAVTGNRFSDIQTAINNAQAGDVILLNDVTYTNDIGNEGIRIDKPITIIGQDGTVLDAGGLSRIFDIQQNINGVTLGNIDFRNGRVTDANGGAIRVGNGCGNIIISNSNFTENHVLFQNNYDPEQCNGGAVYFAGNCHDVEITNCNFVNGTSYNGGGIFIDDGSHDFLIDNCNFTKNHVDNRTTGDLYQGDKDGHGGAIYISPNADRGTISNSNFINNTADISGGAIDNYYGHDWVVINSTFVENTIINLVDRQEDIDFGAGAIWCCNSVMNITNSTFERNVGGYGGALRGAFNVYDSTFENNTAANGNGGAMDVAVVSDLAMKLNLKFVNSTFNNNNAKGNRDENRSEGGAIHIFDIYSINMTNCTCINNTADRGGAVDFYQLDYTNVENCTFLNNTAFHEGGGLAIFCHNSTFKDSNISNNSAGTDGGAIWIIGNDAKFINVTSVNNNASRGGSAYIEGHDILLQDSIFNNNSAINNGSEISGRGGALDILGDNCRLLNVTANNNNASLGGAAFIRGDNTSVRDSTFDGNNATLRGGGLDIAGNGCTFVNVDVSNNNAFDNNTTDSGLGGGIYVVADGTVFTNVTADNNTAKNGGGAYIRGNNIILDNCTLSNNKAINNGTEDSGIGGGLDIVGNGCNMTNITSLNNSAYRGGSTFVRGNNTKIIDCKLDGNNATLRGGGLNIAGENCTVTNVEVSNNYAGLMGGGIYVISDGIVFTNVTADNNTAERGGGAFINGTGVHVLDSEFNKNEARFNASNPNSSGLGGGMDIVGNDCYINNTHSNNNTAYRGGSTFIRGDNTVVENCKLDNNNATLRGGGLNIAGENCNVTNVEVSNNYAGLMGGGIYVVSDGTTFKNVTADNNSAERGGGAFINGTGVHVLDSEFNKNEARFNASNPNSSGLGGGMDIVGNDCYINNTHSNNNTAYRGGSTFIRGDNTVVENCNLTNNNATLRGGGLNIAGDHCTVNNINVSDNHAGLMGGGLYILSNGTTINGITADKNSAERGGSAFINGSNVKVLNGELNNNRANFNESRNDTSGLGGGFDIVGDNILVDNVHSNNNTAYRGGSTFIRGNNVTVSNCNLDNNNATLRGGGLNIGGDNCTIENVSLSNCHATEQGGAVYVIGQDNTFKNVTSVNNTARNGGSSYIEGDNNTVRNCILDNNNATVNGGGLFVNGHNCTFENVDISNCNAFEGGAAYVSGDNAHFDNITSKNNTAIDAGGSTSVHGNNVTVENSIFTNNNVTQGAGGAISVNGHECDFINNTISSNEASSFGGGIYVIGNNCTFSDNRISDNDANFGGGASVFGQDTNFTNNNFTFNEAHTSGGAAYVSGEDGDEITYFTNNNISSNHAGSNGGGICADYETLKLDQIYGYNNTAPKGGFADVINGYEVTVENSTFISNHALGDIADGNGIGGGFLITGSNNVDVQADFYNNTATNGSAIYVGDTTGLSIHDSRFYDNQAHSYYLLAAPENGTVYDVDDEKIVKFSHIGGDNIANAIHNRDGESAITIRNITFPFYHNGVLEDRTTPNEDLIPVLGYSNFNGTNIYIDDLEDNQVIYYEIYNNETGAFIRNGSARTDIDGSISIDVSDLGVGVYLIKAWYNETTYYTEISNETIIVVVDNYDPNMTVGKDSLNGTGILYVEDIVAFNITVFNTGNRVLGNVTVNEIYNSSELEYFDHTDKALWNKSGDVFTYLNDLGIGENATFTIWFRTLTNGTLINNVTAKSNITNETNSSANVTVYNKITINVTKIWNDSNNHDGFRPQNVTFVLYADGIEYARKVLNGTGNVWTGNFTDLPTVNSDGTEIVYTVDELPVANYNKTVTNSSLANYTITNTRVVNYTSVNVTKVWDDDNDHDGFRPANVTFVLLANGNETANVTLSGTGNVWNASFTNLPVYANGSAIVYTIKELTVEYYNSTVTNASLSNYTITNSRIVEYTSVNVTKVWDDDNDHDGFRPDNVTFVLLANGNETANVTLSGAGNVWTASFNDLPVYANGSAIVYTIKELTVEYYNSTVTNASLSNYTITNSRIVEYTSVNVTKVWDDDNNHDGFRPQNVTFVLLANGNETANVTLSGTGNVWTASFNDLPVYANGSAIVYTIKELTVEYYNSTVTNSSLSNYTITNTRIVNFTRINVTKVWNDSDDHDGFRPQNVTFVLLANGNETANVTLSGAGNVWTASFNDLPVYANGSAIVYTIKELTVEYYNSTVTNSSLSNYTITNTRIVNFTRINVTKVWNDSDDHDGFRPQNVTFVLLANGNETANVTLSGAGNVWTASFNDLPVYANGSAIVYTIKELTVEYYNSTVTNASLSNYTITNSRIVEFTSVNVTKVWNDSDDHDGFRPDNVTFVLLANGNETANVTLSGTGNVWTASFNDLPVYANGSAIVYTIKELTVEYYNSTVTNSSLSNYTITNTRIVEFTSVNVTKVWNDSDDHDGFRPDNVTFVLLANGNETANVTLSGTGNVWTASFNDLPVYANGSAIVYTIKELTVEYYNSTVTNSSLSNYTITNTRIVEFTSVNVTKVWNDSDDHDGFRPDNVTFVLLANGNETANVTLSGTGNVWTASFNDLPVYANGSAIVYTIKELTVEYYNSTVTNSSLSNYTITNTRIVEFTSVNVTKVWNDSDDHDGFRPDNVTFVLLANGNETANVTLSGAGNVWTASFNDLPVYANGSAIVYTIKELTVEYYNSTVTNASLSNYTITNSRIVEYTSVNVTKVWDDDNDHDGFRPQNVTFVLLANGNETANVTLSGTGNVWTASFNDLPVYANGSAIVYTIKELTVEYYNSTVTNSSLSNYTITNTRIVNFTRINVTKVWNDSDDHDGFRPQNVTFVLLANGNETANVTLSGTGNVWTASFNDLPVYANGSAIVYTIKELTVEYYNSTVTNSSLSNYTITNTRIVNFTRINVTKVWNDSDDHDGFRPDNVTFVLLANGNETANVTLSGTGNVWTASFNDLPVYANGSAIVYTIKELTVEYYNSTVTNASLSNYTITNSRIVEFTSVNVTKVWNDSDDHDGFRPQNVTFVLLANGNETANVTLSGTGNVWTASFNDLPVYANGSAIVYTIKELTVEYYNSTVTNASLSNYTITNSRIVEFTSVNVTKVWNDSDDHDGFRPQNVTFVLLANGNETANVTLSGTGNVWTASFNDLPVYANGSAIVYTIKELTVEYYNSTVTNSSLSNYTITNTRIVEFTSVNVTKVWNDSDDHDGFRPDNVTFVLLANGNETANVTLSGTGNVWTASFNDLPVYANGSAIVYTIKELTVEYYNSTVTNASLSNYTITNSRIVEFTSVNVTKVWNDSDDHDGFRPDNVTFVLLANGNETANVTLSGTGNVWTASFNDLPVYANGSAIVYTIKELTVEYYNSTVTNSSLSNYTITNSRIVEFTSVNVTKVWNDSDDHDGFRPDNVTFVLLANGNETANVTLSGTGNVWTASFNDLPVYANGSAIVYTIKELTVEYYNSTVTNASLSNYTITNSRIVEFTSVNVTKVWNDSDDHDGFRPDNVTFVLLANGNETANVTLSGTGNVWTASFNDLPVYANGSAIVYTIKELTVEYYNSTVTNSSLSNYTITNTRIVNFTRINVTKVWNDSDDHDGFRPQNVTFVLLANGNETANVTLSGTGNVWTASFNDLPVYANGSAIVYTIKELTVEYYNSTVTNSSLSNYTIT